MARRKKHNRKEKRSSAQRPPKLPAGYSTPEIHDFKLEHPFSNLSDEDRREIIDALSSSAGTRLKEDEAKIRGQVLELEPSQLLATASFYCLQKFLSSETDFTTDGPYTQATVEILQSICLANPRGSHRSHPTLCRTLFPLLELANQCFKDIDIRDLKSSMDFGASAREMSIHAAKTHTRAIRNWGYPQQMRQISHDLFSPMDSLLAKSIGFTACDLLDFFDRIADLACSRAAAFANELSTVFREKSVPDAIRAWSKYLGRGEEFEQLVGRFLVDKQATLKQVQSMVFEYSHQLLPDLFEFNLEELKDLFPTAISSDSISCLVKSLSLSYGDLAEIPFEHMLTQSPIRLKPFIELEHDRYFIPIPGLLNSFCIEINETLIQPVPPAWSKYLEQRSAYLEESVLRELRTAFPEATVEANLKWTDIDSETIYETDVLVVAGPLAFVFECKSNRVSDPARRGGPKRLKRDFENLVDKPSEQATRTATMLERSSEVQFQRGDGSILKVIASDIQRVVCVSVTLDYLPAVTLCWKLLIQAGLVNPANRPTITITLADLSEILEVLEEPSIRLHYFWRRSECEEKVTYLGDEEDLLVYYLSNGFGSLISNSAKEDRFINLWGNSVHLRRHYMANWVDPNSNVPRPRRLVTDWWLQTLGRVQSLPKGDKWHICCSLLDLSFNDQKELEQRFTGLTSLVRRRSKKTRRDAVLCQPPSTESDSAIILFAYRGGTKQQRNSRVESLIRNANKDRNVSRVIVIGRDVDRELDAPYDILVYWDEQRGWKE